MRFTKFFTVLMALMFSAIFGNVIAVSTGWNPLATSGGLFLLGAIPTGAGIGSLLASTGINWSGITLENGAIQSANELIMMETLKAGNFDMFHTLMTKVANGDKLDGIGAFGELGYKEGTTCAPTFNSTQATVVEKTWAIGGWEIAEAMCYKDVEATAGRMALKAGTEIADMTGTDVVDIVVPKMEEQMLRMFWRIAWFGDTAADTISNAGKLKNGTEKKLFTIADGFFKRLLAIIGTTPARKTAITANASATYALQLSDFTNARTILTSMITSANITLRSSADAFIMCTRSIADQFARELTQGTVYTEIQWKTIETGLIKPDGNVQTMQYFEVNGVKVFPIDLWDQYIQTYEDNGTKWNSPHRAVYLNKSNLLCGTPSDELIKTFRIWFSDDDQNVKMLARDKIGTLIFDDTLVQVAI